MLRVHPRKDQRPGGASKPQCLGTAAPEINGTAQWAWTLARGQSRRAAIRAARRYYLQRLTTTEPEMSGIGMIDSGLSAKNSSIACSAPGQ